MWRGQRREREMTRTGRGTPETVAVRVRARPPAAVIIYIWHENDSVCGMWFLPVAGERSKERARIVLHAHKSTGPDAPRAPARPPAPPHRRNKLCCRFRLRAPARSRPHTHTLCARARGVFCVLGATYAPHATQAVQGFSSYLTPCTFRRP